MGIPLNVAPLAYVLMAVIPLVSLYALYLDRSFLVSGLFNVGAVRSGQYYRMVTPVFLHGDLGHLALNLVPLFFFGPAVEFVYGTGGLIIIAIAAQLGGQGFTLWRKRAEPDYQALGASAMVSGVVLAYCVYAPFDMLYFLFVIPVPAFVVGIIFVLYSSFAMRRAGRIAHDAHLGGAIAGAFVAFVMGPGSTV